MQKLIKQKQLYIIDCLVDKLGPEGTSEEDNLNASSILQEALDTKEYYSAISKRHNVIKLLDYAIPSQGETVNVDSQNAAIGVLTYLVA